jgi:hypothetical protein
MFKPKINQTFKIKDREEKVEKLLYKDAIRRQNKMNEQTQVKQEPNKKILAQSQLYYVQRFSRIFHQALLFLYPQYSSQVEIHKITLTREQASIYIHIFFLLFSI